MVAKGNRNNKDFMLNAFTECVEGIPSDFEILEQVIK